MTPFSYYLVLVSIVVGLAIADVMESLNLLLRARHRIRWHWLPLAAALLVLLTILQFWWGFYRLGQIEVWGRYDAFLLLMLHLVLMFLLACAALPDEAPDGLDLAAYYDRNRLYFWSLFSLVALAAILTNLLAQHEDHTPQALLLKTLPNLLYVLTMSSLAFVRSRTYHAGMVLLLLGVMVLGWLPLRLE